MVREKRPRSTPIPSRHQVVERASPAGRSAKIDLLRAGQRRALILSPDKLARP
jgi:hypothetical protein